MLNNAFVGGKALPTPNQTTYEGDGWANKQHLGLCFWNPGPHMAHMGQGPSHDVSDIRGGIPQPAAPHVGEIPPSERFSQGFSITRVLEQAGIPTTAPLIPIYMPS